MERRTAGGDSLAGADEVTLLLAHACEVAAAPGVSRRTVDAAWTIAKAWLKRELRGE